MDKLIYIRGEDTREAKKIEHEIPVDCTAEEFCREVFRLGLGLGFTEKQLGKFIKISELDVILSDKGDKRKILFS